MNAEYMRVLQECRPEDLLRIPVKKRGAPPTGFVVLCDSLPAPFPFTVCPLAFVQKSVEQIPSGNPHDVIVHYQAGQGKDSIEKTLYLLYQAYQDTGCQSTANSMKRYLFEKTLPPRKVLIPSLRRQENLDATLRMFARLDQPREGYMPMICIVEHSPMPELESMAAKYKCEYIWIFLDPRMPQIPVGQFNRALCFDKGVLESSPAAWYLCHDNDLLMTKDFWSHLDANVERTKPKCIQPYTHRCVLYLKPGVANLFREDVSLADKPVDETMRLPLTPGAAGGSLYIHRDRYIEVGGHDPNLCWGYGPEDTMFFQKLLLQEPMAYADEPPIEMIHLWHPPAANLNPFHSDMDIFVKLYFLKQTPEQLRDYCAKKKVLFQTILRERGIH